MKLTKLSKIVLAFVPLAFFSCNTSVEDKKDLELVFITTCVGEDFFKPLIVGMEDAAELMGVECSFIGTPEVDVEAQAAMVSEAVKRGVDGIALNIIDPVGFDLVVEEAMAEGIPVVAFNVDDNESPNMRLSAVCQNLFVAGEQLGQKMESQIPEGSTVLLTMHSEGISALEDRRDGIKKALAHKNIKWVEIITHIFGEESSYIIRDAVNENPEIKYVLCTGLADTEGAGMAIERDFKDKGMSAAGFDLSPTNIQQIKDGNLAFTIDQQPYMQGFYPVIQLVQYLRYGIYPSDVEIGASFVTKENVDQVEDLIEAGYR